MICTTLYDLFGISQIEWANRYAMYVPDQATIGSNTRIQVLAMSNGVVTGSAHVCQDGILSGGATPAPPGIISLGQ
jgi:hypothetical protein